MSASAKKKATTDNVPAIPFRTVGLGRIEAVRFGKHLCDNCSFVPVVSVRDLEILAKSQPVGKDIDVHMDNLMFRLWYIKEKLLPDLASAIENVIGLLWRGRMHDHLPHLFGTFGEPASFREDVYKLTMMMCNDLDKWATLKNKMVEYVRLYNVCFGAGSGNEHLDVHIENAMRNKRSAHFYLPKA